MTQTFSDLSNLILYLAMAVYAVAFICFAFDLANRGSKETAERQRSSALGATGRRSEPVLVASAPAEASAEAAGAGIVTTRAAEGPASAAGDGMRTQRNLEVKWRDARPTRWLNIAMGLTVLAWLGHLAATILRGIAAGRVPWANMYEFSMTSTLIIVAVFLGMQFWQDLRFLGTFITGFVTLTLGIASLGFYVDITPLQPALQSVWLVIHVFVASLATGILALGCGLSVAQLLQQRRERRIRAGQKPRRSFLSALPSSLRLEDMSFRMNMIGFIFWTFTLIAGAIWAERAWGRYWGFDVKETWTFIIWVVYAGYLHARSTRGWRGTASAILSIVGFATVMFNFSVVNVFFKGLHAYSGL